MWLVIGNPPTSVLARSYYAVSTFIGIAMQMSDITGSRRLQDVCIVPA